MAEEYKVGAEEYKVGDVIKITHQMDGSLYYGMVSTMTDGTDYFYGLIMLGQDRGGIWDTAVLDGCQEEFSYAEIEYMVNRGNPEGSKHAWELLQVGD